MRGYELRGILRKTIVVFSSFLILLVLSLGILYILIFFVISQNEESGVKEETYEYKFLEYDPSTETSFPGFLTMFKSLGEDGFIHEYYDDGRHLLISKFEDDEYFCTGSCFCMNERKSTSVATREIFMLVASVSSVLAYNIAKNRFNKGCELELEGLCSSESVVSEVLECNPAIDTENMSSEDDIGEQGNSDDGDEIAYKYVCRGRCGLNKMLVPELWKLLWNDGFDKKCSDLSVESDMYLYKSDRQGVTYPPPVQVRNLFVRRHLNPYCLGNSVGTDWFQSVGGKKERLIKDTGPIEYKKSTRRKETQDVFCEGFDTRVKCILLHPRRRKLQKRFKGALKDRI